MFLGQETLFVQLSMYKKYSNKMYITIYCILYKQYFKISDKNVPMQLTQTGKHDETLIENNVSASMFLANSPRALMQCFVNNTKSV